jgi:hypothetical protein
VHVKYEHAGSIVVDQSGQHDAARICRCLWRRTPTERWTTSIDAYRVICPACSQWKLPSLAAEYLSDISCLCRRTPAQVGEVTGKGCGSGWLPPGILGGAHSPRPSLAGNICGGEGV